MTANTAGSPSAATIIYGAPPTLHLHQIDSGELEKLSKAASPRAIVIASFCGGSFVSLLPTAVSSLGRLGTTFGPLDLSYVLADAFMLFISLYAGYRGYQKQGDVQMIISDIHARAQL